MPFQIDGRVNVINDFSRFNAQRIETASNNFPRELVASLFSILKRGQIGECPAMRLHSGHGIPISKFAFDLSELHEQNPDGCKLKGTKSLL